MNHKHEASWLVKKCMLYILCTLIYSIFFHLTIGSSLILIQNELWVSKCCHAHLIFFFLMFKVFKKCHQDFNLLHVYHSFYTSLFWVKSGEKWLIHNVCFHSNRLFKYVRYIGSLGLGLLNKSQISLSNFT